MKHITFLEDIKLNLLQIIPRTVARGGTPTEIREINN